MLSSILIIILVLALLGGIGFAPIGGLNNQTRGILGTVLLVLFIVWLVKWSHLLG